MPRAHTLLPLGKPVQGVQPVFNRIVRYKFVDRLKCSLSEPVQNYIYSLTTDIYFLDVVLRVSNLLYKQREHNFIKGDNSKWSVC